MSSRLAIFLPSLVAGGAERAMLNLATGMADRGLNVDLVLASAHGPYLPHVPQRIRVIDLGVRRVLASTARLARYLRIERPEVLLAAMDHANLVALWARELSATRTRVFVSTHSMISHSLKGEVPWRERLIPALVRGFYPRADAVVAVSDAVAQDLARVGRIRRERIHVIHNPIVMPGLARLASVTPQHPWFEGIEVPLVSAAGRLAREKDFPTLLRALRLVVRARPARLAILGEGPQRAAMEALIRDLGITGLVEMPGHVDNPYSWMARSSVFVLSSAWEGLPTVLIEAMACGTPVVSTDCPGGVREILFDGKLGTLVPVGDETSMAQAILDVLASPPPKEPLRQRAMDFSLHASVERYLSLISPLVA